MNNIKCTCYKQTCKNKECRLAYMRNYYYKNKAKIDANGAKPKECKTCQKSIRSGNYAKHLQSSIHMINEMKNKMYDDRAKNIELDTSILDEKIERLETIILNELIDEESIDSDSSEYSQ